MESSAKGLVVTLLAMSSAVAAETYQGEGIGRYSHLDAISHYNLQGSLYFNPVSVSDHPLQEAAFLERASNVGLSFTRAEDSDDDAHIDIAKVSINQYLFDSKLYLAGHYYRAEFSGDGFDDSENEWGLSIGMAPIEGLLIYTNYRYTPNFSAHLLSDFVTLSRGRDSYEPNVSAKYVKKLGDGKAYKVEGSLVNSDDGDYLFVAGDYYFSPTFSLGVWVEDDEYFDNQFGMRLEKFITPGFSLTAGFGTSGSLWQIGTRLRF